MRSLPFLLLACALLGCGGDEDPTNTPVSRFTFDSGGAHHIQGLGAWRVEAVRGGAFQAAHQIRDATKNCAHLELQVEDDEVLWRAIDGARLYELKVEDRSGVPDEVRYTFGLTRSAGGESVKIEIWQNDLAKHPSLGHLLGALRSLIEKHHGVKPVF